MTWGVYHDLVSPYLYLTYGQVDRICKGHEALEMFVRRCALRGAPAHGLASGTRAFLVVPSPGGIPRYASVARGTVTMVMRAMTIVCRATAV